MDQASRFAAADKKPGAVWCLILLFVLITISLSQLTAAGGSSELTTLTEEEKQWLSQNPGKLTLWFNDSYPPIEYADEDDKFVGLGADVIALVEKKLGHNFKKIKSADWNAHLKALEAGKCAVAPTIIENPERSQYAFFTTSYARAPVVIIGAQNLGSGLTIKDLAGKKVAVVSGFATESYMRSFQNNGINIVLVKDVSEGLRSVAFGQVDAFIENLAVASYYISQHGISNLKVAGITDYIFEWRIAVSRKYPLLFSSIQKALDNIAPEELAAVNGKWITLKTEQGISPETMRNLKIAATFVLALMLGLALISIFLKRSLNEKISSLEEAHKKLANSETRFRSLFMHAPLPLMEMDRNWQNICVNKSFVDTFGYTNDEIKSLDDWWPLAYPDEEYRKIGQTRWPLAIEHALATNNVIAPQEFNVTCRSGEVKNVLIGASIIEDKILGTLYDVGELKRTQEQLQKSLQCFEELFELAPFPCIITDLSGRYIMANQHFCELVGKTPKEIIGKPISSFERFADSDQFNQVQKEIIRSGVITSGELAVSINGKKHHLLFSSKTIDWNGQKSILTASVDISERRQAEEALKHNEENLRVTLNSIGDAVIATDTQGMITRMNPVAERLTGWESAEAEGQSLPAVFRIVNAKTRETLESPVSQVLATGEVVALAKNSLLIARDGKEYLIADSGAPIRNDSGDIIGVVLVFRDVTEEQAIQEQLRQSQKMDAIGQLAGGVAHDFNNMLGGIIGAAELLGKWLKESPEADKLWHMIIDTAERAASLNSKLLSFARKQPVNYAAIDIQQPVRDAISLLKRTVDRRIKIETSFSARELPVVGDFSHLQSAFLNILINAAQAMPEGGTIYVSTRVVELDAYYCRSSQFRITPGAYAEVEIKDTGCGIPREMLPHIFEPFFTTKSVGKGTGLGLAAVFGIVQQHGGAINAYSEVGTGTSLHVLIPVSTESAAEYENEEQAPLRGNGTILVVDDEEVIRSNTEAMLTDLGYRVMTAENGSQAEAIFSEKHSEIDLVILDMVMPVMNGKECFAAMKKIKPDLKVVIASGFVRDEDLEPLKAAGVKSFIHKPFRILTLSQIVHETINS
ncbi:MAG: hypothetical protein GQF41_2585 [Candidatus Rifleibacterium amylolyticum]|nr:MAG: hypothetical protein GQF41_2585 [Candidatus Rifleibacterium amylolyticum]